MIEVITDKCCSVCETVKPLTEYYKQNKKRKDGTEWIYHNPECKDCTKERATKWGKDNREAQKEHNVKYKKTKRAKQLRKEVWMKNYYESGKRKEWVENNPDKMSGYNHKKAANKTHKISKNEWENCKNYFNYRCAYCNLKIEDHYIIFARETRLGDFHKEHVDHNGGNDLSNCIPSCKACNVQKNTYSLTDWYNETNDNYIYERLEKINKWLTNDYIIFKDK